MGLGRGRGPRAAGTGLSGELESVQSGCSERVPGNEEEPKEAGSSVLCDHLEGWDREGGREGDARGKRYGNVCIRITDSLYCKAETNTPL